MSQHLLSEFSIKNAQVYDRSSPKKWLWSHVRRYWPMTLYVLLGSITFISMRSLIPVKIGEAFQKVVEGAPQSDLLVISVIIVGIAIGNGLINLTTAWTNEAVAQRIERDAREELFIGLLSKSQTFHDQQRVGDLMARATNDVKQLNLMISPALNLILQAMIGLVVPIVLMASFHWQLLLAPTVFVIVSIWSLKQYIARLGPLTGKLRGQFGQLNAVLSEIISNIKVVRNFVQDAHEKGNFQKEVEKFRALFVENGDLQARYLPLLFLGLTTAGGLLHALLLMRAGQLEFGGVIAYVGLLGQLRFPTFISLFSLSLVQLGLASAARILETLNSDTEIDQNSAGYAEPMRGELRFDHVSFRYHPDAPLVLKDISFEVKPGQRVAIVGPTGSGKSTLVKLLQRLYDSSEGEISVDGIPLRAWNLAALRSQLGVIEQDTFLFSRPIADNIAFGQPGATLPEIEAAARSAQAHEYISSFDKGYQTEVGTRGVTLSGGQKQRLAIARALLSNPPVLALDDATSAVDSATEDAVQRALRSLLKGRTSLVITHRLAQIRHADLILVMLRGQIVAQGTHEELIRNSLEYREIFEVYGAVLPPMQASGAGASGSDEQPGEAHTTRKEASSWQA